MNDNKKFVYDFHNDVRVDISPNSLILTAFNQPVNYQQPVSKILTYGKDGIFSMEKIKVFPTIKLKSGRVLPSYMMPKIFRKEYNKIFKKSYFSCRKKIIGKNPEQDKCNSLCANWGRIFKQKPLDDVTTYGADLPFLLEQPYRCSLAEFFGKRASIQIKNIEELNHDFLVQTKYLINPPVIELLLSEPNIPANLSKSHIQLLACAKYNKNQEMFDVVKNMSKDEIAKAKKEVGKKTGNKFDFRKFKHVRQFYRYYSYLMCKTKIILDIEEEFTF